jgi:hypothetical protein
LCVFVVLCAPLFIRGEVLYLKDGSTIRGSVVAFERDTLTFDAAFGGRVRMARSQIVKIVFSDSVATAPVSPGVKYRPPEPPRPEGGYLSVTFKDKKVSSKVVVHNKKNTEQLIKANWVVQSLMVDGDTVFTHVDSTMDKTIHKGHDKFFKNSVELEDMNVELDAGLHNCVVVVHNRGLGTYDDDFDHAPLDMSLNLDNIQIFPGRTTSVHVGINKGTLRLGKARLYRVQ